MVIFILPIWAIWRLRLGLSRKLGVCAIFLTGLNAIASSLGRLIFSIKGIGLTDSLYSTAHIALWTVAELDSILICTCLPMMPAFSQLLLRIMSRMFPVTGQNVHPYQRFQGGKRTNPNHNVVWPSTAKAWTVVNNNGPFDGIDRTISVELSSKVRQAQDFI